MRGKTFINPLLVFTWSFGYCRRKSWRSWRPWGRSLEKNLVTLLVFLYKLEVLNDLQYRLRQIYCFIFPVFLDWCWVFGSDIHEHCSLKVHLYTFPSMVGTVSQKTNNFVKNSLITAGIFVYILKFCKFLRGGIVHQMWCAHRIHILETLLEDIPNFLWAFALNDWLVLVRDEFKEDAYNFPYCKVIFFLISYYAVNQNLWSELGNCKSFLYEFLMDRLDCRSLFSCYHGPLILLLSEFAYSV